MSENSLVYEMTKMMNDKPAIQNDMNEAIRLVQKMFEEKYITKINNVINTHTEKARQNPSREINLLHACKAFMPESERQKIDRLIDSLFMFDTLSSIRNEYSAIAANKPSEDSNPVKPPDMAASSPVNSSNLDISPPIKAACIIGDKSVHSDGIYDIDNQCMVSKNKGGFALMPIFMLMSMSLNNTLP